MAKWVSPLFTDASGQIAKSVVFSRWKGRQYIRSYVKPSNPRTLKQQANRDVFKNLVRRWQSLSTDELVKSAWNERALEYVISGYNLFMKWGKSSWIKLSTNEFPEGTTYPQTITIYYKCGVPLSEARIYMFDGSSWKDITPMEGLTSQGEITVEIPSSGVYEFYIATSGVLISGHSPPQYYQAITKWYPDYNTGKALEAVLNAK